MRKSKRALGSACHWAKHGEEELGYARTTEERKSRRSRPSGREGDEFFSFSKSVSYLVFNSKPTSNVNQIKFEYTFLIQIKIRNFGMLPKINFTKLKNPLFSNFLFFYFKPLFNFICKSNLNHSKSSIKTTQPNTSNARACMHKHVAKPYGEF